jgi:hypothetical protein
MKFALLKELAKQTLHQKSTSESELSHQVEYYSELSEMQKSQLGEKDAIIGQLKYQLVSQSNENDVLREMIQKLNREVGHYKKSPRRIVKNYSDQRISAARSPSIESPRRLSVQRSSAESGARLSNPEPVVPPRKPASEIRAPKPNLIAKTKSFLSLKKMDVKK